jgi:transcriptional regulator with GAF, ATPase, and Fis domain
VLITGETGTGKELVARAIHRSSDRASKPMVAFNCAALIDTLLESELFGHERGAFTGADRAREGLFEAAHQGTLFLDEAAEMSMAAQAKLLRVLTDGQLMRVGSSKPRQVDVRVIVATHRDLRERVREGLFREDLYYRLAVVPLSIPPLRDRREEIPEFCRLFLVQAARDLKVHERKLSPEAISSLLIYDFPGNIRELKNLIERACILSTGDEIGVENFPMTTPNSVARSSASLTAESPKPENVAEMMPQAFDLRLFLNELEKAFILRVLSATSGAQAEAARRLGVSRSDLSYKLAKYGLRTSPD